MYCPRCRKDVGNTEFCENCGAATTGNIAHEQAAASAAIPNDDVITFDTIKASVKKIPVKKIIVLALVAVIAIAAFIGYKSLETYASPKATAERYINALVAGEYDKAFEMVEGTDDSFLTKDYYIKYMELLKVKGKRIVSLNQNMKDTDEMAYSFFGTTEQREKISEDNAQYFTAQVDTEFFSMVLVKRGKVYGLFDGWKVDTRNFIKSWEITVPKGAKVAVDGKPVEKLKSTEKTEKNNLFGTPAKETLTFQIEKMFPGEYEITATLEGAKDIKIKALIEQPQTLNFEPTDKLVADLRQVADSSLNLYYSNAGKSSFDGLVNPESQFIKNLGNSWYDDRSRYKNLKLNSIETTAQSIQDADHAQLTVVAKFQYDYEVWNWTETKIETRQDEQEYTMSFVRNNEKWTIDEINNKGF